MKTIEKVNKKAWKDIQNISTANNMADVRSSINNALLDTFGLRNLGLLKIRLKDNEKFSKIKAYRQANFDTYGEIAKAYLISFIPERLKKSHMYIDLVVSK